MACEVQGLRYMFDPPQCLDFDSLSNDDDSVDDEMWAPFRYNAIHDFESACWIAYYSCYLWYPQEDEASKQNCNEDWDTLFVHCSLVERTDILRRGINDLVL